MPARQVIKNKPNPCGVKIFVAAATDGLPLDMFFYQGKGDPIVSEECCATLDIGGKAVMKLTRNLPPGMTIYMDRFFTSTSLLDLLHSEAECQATGTVRKSKIPVDSKLKQDKVLEKEGRGAIDQSVRSDGQISIIKWFDNKPVVVLSSKEGSIPIDKCSRWRKKEGRRIEVERPFAVKEYNTNMGGVDFLDRLISLYRIKAKTKKNGL